LVNPGCCITQQLTHWLKQRNRDAAFVSGFHPPNKNGSDATLALFGVGAYRKTAAQTATWLLKRSVPLQQR
jgi:hypothetical protein